MLIKKVARGREIIVGERGPCVVSTTHAAITTVNLILSDRRVLISV